MVIEVTKMEIKHVMDASGLDACIQDGLVNADEVVAVIGKTEGNGGVNDFTRILSDRAFRDVLHKHGTRSEAQIKEIPMVWSGGCDGVLTPHATVFASDARSGSPGKSRLVMGTAISDRILPEHIGRPEMVEIVADGVRQAMRDAGITDPADVHYVQTKTPLLTIDTIQDAHDRGHSVFCEVHESMGVSNGTTGLGIAVALGEIGIPEAEDICRNLNLYSSVASCSSGVELDSAQIVLFGNRDGAGGRYRIGHSVMKDALDIDGIYNAIRDAGLDLPERPRASDLDGKVVNCFLKCEADPRAKLRGRRQIMLDDSDVHHHRHSKAAVGAIAALAIGDPAVFVSVDAMHQGPSGGGPAIAIVDLGEPPAKGDRAVGLHLAELVNNPIVERANRIAFDRYLNANPVLVGVGTAGRDLPDMGERTILHAGPPVPWDGMCGPMQGGVIGAILYEGWADTVEDARRLAASGDITFDSCHHHGAVGPMAGLISPSMPIWIVENTEHGNRAYSTLNEGPGKVLRYGAYSPDVIERLKLIENRLAPVLGKALEIGGPVDLKPFLAQALHMGDECHNRNVAGSSLLVKKLVPLALRGDLPAEYVAATVDYVANNDVFFLNVSMAACKAMLDVAHDVPGSSMVTAMARNGVNFGIRVSGTGSSWFETPAPLVEGLYFPGYSIADAGADMGDSAITETAGLGGFAMAASPAIVLFIGGTPAEALSASREMRKITLGVNRAFTLPALDFANTAAGIDIRKVVDSGIQPIVNTGIAHKEAGIGQIGAGITEAPGECFTQAITALHRAVADLDG